MSEYDLHSLVLASDYRVKDVERMWATVKGRRSIMANMGAHHVVVYSSISEPGRVLVTVGIRHRLSVTDVVRSPAMFEWFDIAGVDDIPALFAGEVVEKIDLYGPSPDDAVAGVIVGAVSAVDDVPALMVKVHGALDRFRQAGVLKVWVYRAFDDGREVMILQEFDSEDSAQRWVDHPDPAAEWMSRAGLGAYPAVFIGRLAYVMSVEEKR
jgi:heme-degrading monooxygenase HmoA